MAVGSRLVLGVDVVPRTHPIDSFLFPLLVVVVKVYYQYDIGWIACLVDRQGWLVDRVCGVFGGWGHVN
jgi:hypothetical protein